MGLKEFEFSQNWAMFWDKLERANYFLEAVIETADRDIDDRTVAHLLEAAAEDGGQWNMFVALVRKHGLVPKAVMPETQSSSDTGRMNSVLRSLLRQGARSVRAARETGIEAAREEKPEILRVIYRMLCIHLGTPPERFDWQWTDKDKQFHRDGELTPLEFAAKYVDLPLDDYVCLVHDPRPTSPVGKTFTVEYLGNVVGAPPVTYLNVDMRDDEGGRGQGAAGRRAGVVRLRRRQDDEQRDGIWDASLYDLPGVYGTEFALDKADRLIFHETLMTHAMLFTGVDIADGQTRKWRVENSWGSERGKGFYTMNDSWFDEYVFEIAARRDLLPPELQEALGRADRAARLGPDGGPGRPGRKLIPLLSEAPPTFVGMPPMPRVTGQELVRALSRLGWVVIAQRGSHAQLKHPVRSGRVTVPLHAGETLGPGLLRSILNQAGLAVDDLRDAL